MSFTPIITRVLLVPGWPDHDQTAVSPFTPTIAVGLIIDGQQVAWGQCVGERQAGLPGSAPPFRIQQGLATLRDKVVPLLEGRSLIEYKSILTQIDALTETVTIKRPSSSGERVSRRDLFTGKLWGVADNSVTEAVREERPLHPAIRYGVSQALLAALAQVRGVTLTKLIATEFDFSFPPLPVPLQVTFSLDEADRMAPYLTPRVRSLAYHIAVDAEIGKQAEQLQRFVRRLSELITAVGGSGYRPQIHLSLNGALGWVYGPATGQLLGALYGLEQAAKPFSLTVADPVVMPDRQRQIEQMRQLREYLRLRQMQTRLVARAWVDNLDAVRQFVTVGATPAIQLSLTHMGSVAQTLAAVKECGDGETAVFLDGVAAGADHSVITAAHVALAAQPEQVILPSGDLVARFSGEMNRTLARIAAK